MSFPTYHEALDVGAMLRDYPVGEDFVRRYTAMSRDELHAVQDRQFTKLMARGWQIPFYQRLWGAKGSSPATFAASPTSPSCRSTTSRT
jgi:phenylacetate-CoA ligase